MGLMRQRERESGSRRSVTRGRAARDWAREVGRGSEGREALLLLAIGLGRGVGRGPG